MLPKAIATTSERGMVRRGSSDSSPNEPAASNPAKERKPALAAKTIVESPTPDGMWRIALGLFVVGWILQFIGHYFEGKPPEFMKDYRFLFVGTRWWLQKVLHRR